MSTPTRPPADRLIHIGAPKCGSTALQSWLAGNRAALSEQGIRYVSEGAHWIAPAKGVVGEADRVSGKPVPIREWERLVAAVRKATPKALGATKAIISSEWYAGASNEAVQRIARDLDASRLQVLLFVRPLALTLVSAWQQGLKLGGSRSLAEWLATIFDEPSSPTAERLWRKHRYDQIAERWATQVGADRVSVVILDPTRPESLFRTVEALLGVAPGSAPVSPSRTNQSLSPFESDVLLALNREFYARGGTLREYRQGVLRSFDGYVNSIRTGAPEKMRLPASWEPRVASLNDEIVGGIERSGATVIGAIQDLRMPASSGAPEPERADLSAQAASAAGLLYSVLVTTGVANPAPQIKGFGSRRERTFASLRRSVSMLYDALRRKAR